MGRRGEGCKCGWKGDNGWKGRMEGRMKKAMGRTWCSIAVKSLEDSGGWWKLYRRWRRKDRRAACGDGHLVSSREELKGRLLTDGFV